MNGNDQLTVNDLLEYMNKHSIKDFEVAQQLLLSEDKIKKQDQTIGILKSVVLAMYSSLTAEQKKNPMLNNLIPMLKEVDAKGKLDRAKGQH